MKAKGIFYSIVILFFLLFFIWGFPVIYSETESVCRASYEENTIYEPRGYSSVLEWKIKIDNKDFYIIVDRDIETIIIRGIVDCWEEAKRVEHIVRLRAPNTFRIINAIVIN